MFVVAGGALHLLDALGTFLHDVALKFEANYCRLDLDTLFFSCSLRGIWNRRLGHNTALAGAGVREKTRRHRRGKKNIARSVSPVKDR